MDVKGVKKFHSHIKKIVKSRFRKPSLKKSNQWIPSFILKREISFKSSLTLKGPDYKNLL